MNIEPFVPYHLRLLEAQGIQPSQRGSIGALLAEFARSKHPGGYAFTGKIGPLILGCAGVLPVHGRIGIAWAVLSDRAGPHMLAITRAVKRFLETQKLQRIEASVEAGFVPGDRWLLKLGFTYEGPMYCYGPNGETHHRYARLLPINEARALFEQRVA